MTDGQCKQRGEHSTEEPGRNARDQKHCNRNEEGFVRLSTDMAVASISEIEDFSVENSKTEKNKMKKD